jgi:hypothetical protein
MRLTESEELESRSKRSSTRSMKTRRESTFLLCIRTDGSEDLEVRKVYEMLPDSAATQEGYVRVIDESGEDYLYPMEYFTAVELPAAVRRKLRATATAPRQPAQRRQRPKTPRRAHA